MLALPVDLRSRLRAQIMGDEGFRPKVYTDTRGRLTIGYGRCLSTTDLSVDEGLFLLDNDIAHAEKDLWHYCPWYADLDDVRKTAIINMAFQLGIQGLLGFKDMIFHLQEKDYVRAARAMMDSSWNSETPARCHRLALVIETGSL